MKKSKILEKDMIPVKPSAGGRLAEELMSRRSHVVRCIIAHRMARKTRKMKSSTAATRRRARLSHGGGANRATILLVLVCACVCVCV